MGFAHMRYVENCRRMGSDYLIVTPDMHRIHHSKDRIEHNRNFGFNFSFWGRLFGSYLEVPGESHESMEIGIKGYAGPRTRSLTGAVEATAAAGTAMISGNQLRILTRLTDCKNPSLSSNWIRLKLS